MLSATVNSGFQSNACVTVLCRLLYSDNVYKQIWTYRFGQIIAFVFCSTSNINLKQVEITSLFLLFLVAAGEVLCLAVTISHIWVFEIYAITFLVRCRGKL